MLILQIQQYVRELNSLDCRKDRKPLDVNNVIYWFKNARAAQKRNELRYNGLAAFPHTALHHHPHHHQHHHQSPMSAAAIHLHNQAHNHHSLHNAISPDDDDSTHLHHSHHHRVPRSLDSDHEPENSQEGDDSEEGGRGDRGFPHHHHHHSHHHPINDSRGSRGSSEEISTTTGGVKDNDSGDEGEEPIDGVNSRKIKRDPLDDLPEKGGKSGHDNDDEGEEMDTMDLKGTRDLDGDQEENGGNGEKAEDDKRSQERKKVVVKEEHQLQQHDDDYISVDVELTEGTSPGDCCSNNNEPKDLTSGGRKSSRSTEFDDEHEQHHRRPEKEDSVSPAVAQQGIGGGVSSSNTSSEDNKNSSKDGGGGRVESRLTPDDDPLHPQQQHLRHVSNHSTSSSISPRSSPGVSPSHNYEFSGAPSMVGRFPALFEHPSFMAYRHFNSFNFGGGNFPGSGNGGDGGPVGYESALSMVAASTARGKGMLTPGGKPSPPGASSLDLFHEFQNGLPGLMSGPGGRPGGSSGVGGGNGGNGDPLSRLRGDELCSPRGVSSADIISSIINSNRVAGGGGDMGMGPLNLGAHHHHMNHHPSPNSLSSSLDERRKRNRTFIDPVTEVPRLEQWFGLNTHPSHNLILKYTEELNRMPYRQKFPKLEPKNVQFWFKNRRAKCKRLKMTL